jgi:hypothetical protein
MLLKYLPFDTPETALARKRDPVTSGPATERPAIRLSSTTWRKKPRRSPIVSLGPLTARVITRLPGTAASSIESATSAGSPV